MCLCMEYMFPFISLVGSILSLSSHLMICKEKKKFSSDDNCPNWSYALLNRFLRTMDL